MGLKRSQPMRQKTFTVDIDPHDAQGIIDLSEGSRITINAKSKKEAKNLAKKSLLKNFKFRTK